MRAHRNTIARPLKYIGLTALVMATVACGGGNTVGSAEAQSVDSDATTKQALGVPSGWVGRKPPTEVAKKITALEASGALPKLDTSNSIAGPDLDNNGIRDDIDRYIEQQNFVPEVKPAIQQKARAYQKVITADLNSPSAIEAAKNYGVRANKCIMERFKAAYFGGSDSGEEAVIDKIKALTLNTKNRLLAWVEFDKKMNGQTFVTQPGEACE